MKYISDEDKMRVALDEAKKAFDIDEVPVVQQYLIKTIT